MTSLSKGRLSCHERRASSCRWRGGRDPRVCRREQYIEPYSMGRIVPSPGGDRGRRHDGRCSRLSVCWTLLVVSSRTTAGAVDHGGGNPGNVPVALLPESSSSCRGIPERPLAVRSIGGFKFFTAIRPDAESRSRRTWDIGSCWASCQMSESSYRYSVGIADKETLERASRWKATPPDRRASSAAEPPRHCVSPLRKIASSARAPSACSVFSLVAHCHCPYWTGAKRLCFRTSRRKTSAWRANRRACAQKAHRNDTFSASGQAREGTPWLAETS